MLWHCFSPWKLVPLDIWTSLNLESPLTWFCSHSDVANLIFARELHGILSKQICYLLWLLPLSVISQPLHLENTTLRPFHEARSFTAMQQKGHHAAKRQLHDTFNSGETAEGKKKERKKKKNLWVKKQTDMVWANVSWGQISDTAESIHSPLNYISGWGKWQGTYPCQRSRPFMTGSSWPRWPQQAGASTSPS